MGIIRRILGQAKPTDKAGDKRKKPRRVHVQLTLEDMPADKLCTLLEIRDIRGPLASVIQGRKLVCNWVSKVGVDGLSERRSLVLRELKTIEGIYLVE